MLFENGEIAGELIHVPGNDHGRIAPDCGCLMNVNGRNRERHKTAVVLLFHRHVIKIFP